MENPKAVVILGPDETLELEEALLYGEVEEVPEPEYSALACHIKDIYRMNKEARQNSGIEEIMLRSARAFNGQYDPADLERISEQGGSEIYMNLTATKCRAAMSWIKDIMVPARGKAWSLAPTAVPNVPQSVTERIEAELQKLIGPQEGLTQATEALEVVT